MSRLTPETSHTCPHRSCGRLVSDEVFACPEHWYQIDWKLRYGLQDAVRRMPGSDLHARARKACLLALGVAVQDLGHPSYVAAWRP